MDAFTEIGRESLFDGAFAISGGTCGYDAILGIHQNAPVSKTSGHPVFGDRNE